MKRNVGSTDGLARTVLGLIIGIAAIAVAIIAGVVLLVTGATNRCPLYAGLGIDTLTDRQ